MSPETAENLTPQSTTPEMPVDKQDPLVESPKSGENPLNKVTSFSKILAAVLFISLPFVGFYLGKEYQDRLSVNTTTDSSSQQADTEDESSDSEVSTEEEDADSDSDTTDETEEETLLIYLYETPIEPNTLGDKVAVDRTTTSDDLISAAMAKLIAGPTTDEEALGYIVPFSLTGTSTCGGNDFSYTKDGTTVNLTICRDIDEYFEVEGAYAGITLTAQSRVLEVINDTLTDLDGVSSVAVYDKNGSCYGLETGRNTCE